MTAQKSSHLNDDEWINIITSSECYMSKCFNTHHALYIMSFAAAWWVCLSWRQHDAIVQWLSQFMPERGCNIPIRMLDAQVLLRRATGPRLYTQHDLASNTHIMCKIYRNALRRSIFNWGQAWLLCVCLVNACSQMVCCRKACIIISGLGQLGQLASL